MDGIRVGELDGTAMKCKHGYTWYRGDKYLMVSKSQTYITSKRVHEGDVLTFCGLGRVNLPIFLFDEDADYTKPCNRVTVVGCDLVRVPEDLL